MVSDHPVTVQCIDNPHPKAQRVDLVYPAFLSNPRLQQGAHQLALSTCAADYLELMRGSHFIFTCQPSSCLRNDRITGPHFMYHAPTLHHLIHWLHLSGLVLNWSIVRITDTLAYDVHKVQIVSKYTIATIMTGSDKFSTFQIRVEVWMTYKMWINLRGSKQFQWSTDWLIRQGAMVDRQGCKGMSLNDSKI